MKLKYFDNILKYLPVLLACILIGLFGRNHFINKGVDEFTVLIIFWVYAGLGIVIFAALNLFLDPIVSFGLKLFSKYVNPVIIKCKIALFNKNQNAANATESFEADVINTVDTEEVLKIENLLSKQLKSVLDVNLIDESKEKYIVVDSARSLEVAVVNTVDTQEVRKIEHEKKLQEYQEKLQIAFNYTTLQFASYLPDKEIALLCNAVESYSKNEEISSEVSVKVAGLSNLDLYHFGWNIWKYFNVSKQVDIAVFLKKIFADALKDVEVESIKRHLKDDEQKGIITITDNLSDFLRNNN